MRSLHEEFIGSLVHLCMALALKIKQHAQTHTSVNPYIIIYLHKREFIYSHHLMPSIRKFVYLTRVEACKIISVSLHDARRRYAQFRPTILLLESCSYSHHKLELYVLFASNILTHYLYYHYKCLTGKSG